MQVRHFPDPQRFKTLTTAELRDFFLVDDLFTPGELRLHYSHIDRAIIGSAVPVGGSLKLEGSKKEMAADYFAQRREVGVINIGGAGSVVVDDENYQLENRDCLYIGRGAKQIAFSSLNKSEAAKFYIVSYPAHTSFPTRLAKQKDAQPVILGSQQEANARTIYKYIHPAGIQSCQLVLGFTTLEKGSVWNTMPAHTHERRSEIYMYFDLPEGGRVCHIMGQPDETRHLFVDDGQAVISPSWSLHSGCGTQAYSFVWHMGGENQDFDDMDFIPMDNLA